MKSKISNPKSEIAVYRPPPAQAQAQPAQAHAQAHDRPPLLPPPRQLLLPLELVLGTGLVRLVMPEVKLFTSPSTRLEKPCTLPTTEAAKAEPGMLTFPPDDPGTDKRGVTAPPPVETGR